MATPLIKAYEVTGNNVKTLTSPTATMNLNSMTVAISWQYLINSFSTGAYAVIYRLTPDGGSVGSWLNATIKGATVSTNGGVLKAKSRNIKQSLTWNAFTDILPQKYTKIELKVSTTDSDSVAGVAGEIDMGVQDLRVIMANHTTKSHGTDTTPTFSFQCPRALKSYKVKPVLEYGTTADLSTIDHTITAFKYHNGTAYVAGDATNGNAVATATNLKLQITASTAMTGTEYWRIRLVPVSFV